MPVTSHIRDLAVAADALFVEKRIAQVHDQELRREGLAGCVRRAHGLAAPALGAGVEVELLLPAQLLHVLEPYGRLGEVSLGQHSLG